MAYRLFIFDFDGTLANSAPQMGAIMARASAHFGFRVLDEAEIEALRGKDNRTILKEMGVPMWRLPQIAAFVRKIANEEAPAPLFDGVPEALRALHGAGATLAIVSSNGEPAIRRALGEDLAALFTAYACDAALFGKAAKFKTVLKRTRIPARDALAIGDEVRDIEAARAAGIACAAVPWGYAARDLLTAHAPDLILSSVSEIAALATQV